MIDRITQANILERELIKAVYDYIEYAEYRQAMADLYAGKWNKDIIKTIVLKGNYNGAVLRNTYRKYVRKIGFETAVFWDAVVKVFIIQGVWRFDLIKVIEHKDFIEAIRKTNEPEWTKVGLVGTDWRILKRMCDEFCEYMDELEKEEEWCEKHTD